MYSDTSKCRIKCKLSVCGFSIATALTSGLMVFILGLMAAYLDIGTPYVTLLGSVYKGYAATYAGSLIGAGWAFACGLISGFFFSIFYNIVLKCCCCCHCKACKACRVDHVEHIEHIDRTPPRI